MNAHPHFWIPRTKIIEPKRELLAPRTGVSGRFKIEGRLDDGRQRLLADWQPNLVTDDGLARWGVDTVVSFCSVGTGNTTPSVGDTELSTFTASASAVSTSAGAAASPPYYGWRIFTCTFAPPGGGGYNLAEIGLGRANNGTQLFTRALIKDGNGDPTTITWLPVETLIITYEMRNYMWTDDVEVTTNISGTDHDVVIRPAEVDNANYWRFSPSMVSMLYNASGSSGTEIAYDGALGVITGTPTGTSVNATGQVLDEAYNGTFKRTGYYTWSPSVANFAGGIDCFLFSHTNGGYQMSFTPPIMKTNTDTLTLNVSTCVWGRYP